MRNQLDHESPDEYELDLNRATRGFGGRNGRIILLGDGTEVLTDSDDAEMFDHSEEDKDEENQIKKGTPATSVNDNDSTRSEREGTPGPQSASDEAKPMENVSQGPQTTIKGVADEPRKSDE